MIAVLPTPASPISTGLFFVRRQSISIEPFDLVLTADKRIELSGSGIRGQITCEFLQA